VTYAEPTTWHTEDGEVLICCARPAAGDESLELEL
jgi:hypothetical protein